MRNEKISFVINCISKGNSFDPSSIHESTLVDLGIMNESKELLESRLGSLATYFKFRNKRTIKVTKNELSISSMSYDSTLGLFNSLIEFFKNARVNKIEFKIDEHFISDEFPKKVFAKFPEFENLDLDAFRYKKDKYNFTLYNCHPQQMHLKIESYEDFEKNSQLEKIDFEKIFNIKSLWKLREIFVNNLLILNQKDV